jgi:hypothetical protein
LEICISVSDLLALFDDFDDTWLWWLPDMTNTPLKHPTPELGEESLQFFLKTIIIELLCRITSFRKEESPGNQ